MLPRCVGYTLASKTLHAGELSLQLGGTEWHLYRANTSYMLLAKYFGQ